MTLPQEGIEGLEAEPFEYQGGGTVVVTPTDGTPGGKGTPSKTFQNVEIKLKGKPQGSFEDLDHKAAFKLKFKKAEPFFGLRKLTLNNMTQDPSMIHESLAYTAFAAAGVPASRSGYAYVWLNGEKLRPPPQSRVARHRLAAEDLRHALRRRNPAPLRGQRIRRRLLPGKESRFEVDEGEDDTSDLTALIAAVDAAAADPLPPSLSTLVDLDEMTRMWGVEKYIGHWDGYAGEGIPGEEEFNEHRPNNYYLYSDPSGRFSMLPWGTDQTWDERVWSSTSRTAASSTSASKTRPAPACSRPPSPTRWSKSAASTSSAGSRHRRRMLAPWQALEEAPRKPYGSRDRGRGRRHPRVHRRRARPKPRPGSPSTLAGPAAKRLPRPDLADRARASRVRTRWLDAPTVHLAIP